jgi:hypothetical protein
MIIYIIIGIFIISLFVFFIIRNKKTPTTTLKQNITTSDQTISDQTISDQTTSDQTTSPIPTSTSYLNIVGNIDQAAIDAANNLENEKRLLALGYVKRPDGLFQWQPPAWTMAKIRTNPINELPLIYKYNKNMSSNIYNFAPIPGITKYTITVIGGGGGGGGSIGYGTQGGNGSVIRASFREITTDFYVTIVVGGGGEYNSSGFAGGGGGLSQVLVNYLGRHSSNTCYINMIAGGGGGGGMTMNGLNAGNLNQPNSVPENGNSGLSDGSGGKSNKDIDNTNAYFNNTDGGSSGGKLDGQNEIQNKFVDDEINYGDGNNGTGGGGASGTGVSGSGSVKDSSNNVIGIDNSGGINGGGNAGYMGGGGGGGFGGGSGGLYISSLGKGGKGGGGGGGSSTISYLNSTMLINGTDIYRVAQSMTLPDTIFPGSGGTGPKYKDDLSPLEISQKKILTQKVIPVTRPVQDFDPIFIDINTEIITGNVKTHSAKPIPKRTISIISNIISTVSSTKKAYTKFFEYTPSGDGIVIIDQYRPKPKQTKPSTISTISTTTSMI